MPSTVGLGQAIREAAAGQYVTAPWRWTSRR